MVRQDERLADALQSRSVPGAVAALGALTQAIRDQYARVDQAAPPTRRASNGAP